MPREATDIAHLWDMLHAARGIESAVAGLELEHYLQDEDLRMSVERRIEIIGEAARRVSDACKVAHPEIPWRRMISQRNVPAHEYDEVVRSSRLARGDGEYSAARACVGGVGDRTASAGPGAE
jgi:uncharacterized protein with HEPN domain